MTVDRMKLLSPVEIEAHLKAGLSRWRYEDGWLRRTYRTSGWKASLMVVNAIGHLAEAAWHHPELAVCYASVKVRLQSHDAKGITARDVALAQKIEEVVLWRPGAEPDAPLEGTPGDDPRYAYVIYD